MGVVHQQRQDWPEIKRREKRRGKRKEEIEDEAGGWLLE